ncbi:hypothetical protein VKS41_005895 [Umbelopsis sp. WA50703]
MSDAASETQIRPAAQVMDDHSSIASYDEKEIHPRSKYRDYMNPRRRKYWYLCVPTTIVIVVLVVVLILFVAFPKIAQNTINGSSISVDSASISFENTNGGSVTKRDTPNANSTFILSMNSSLSHTGIFSATIKFDTISVYYNSNNSDILLGTMDLPSTSVSGGHGSLSAKSQFVISNQQDFGNFAKYMLAADSFDWILKGSASITALGRTANVDLDKTITMQGMKGFPNVTITSFNLPYDDPAGGIHMTLGTVLVNPSPIGVQLGTIQMNVGYQGVHLGLVEATNVNLVKGPNTLNLVGRMVPLTNPNDLNLAGQLFSNYLAGIPSNTTASGVSAAPDGVHPITWLSEGLESVQLDVSLAPNSALKIITGVTMGNLDLVFTNATAYSPSTSAPNVTANFVMPFGFSLNITEVTQNITLGTNATGPIASLNSGYVQSHSNQSLGLMTFALNNAPLTVLPGKEADFNDFNANLTRMGLFNFTVAGNASIAAGTPIGTVRLTNIPFNTTTSLTGLQNLNTSQTVINSIDVTGGTASGLNLAISVGMNNPSNLQIATGDVTFQMTTGQTLLGLVTLPNLNLTRGANTVQATGSFDPKSSTDGQNLLTTFVEGKQNTVGINGFNGTTPIMSLQEGLEGIILSSVMPGLNSTIVQKASLAILDTTVANNIANTVVTVANPFTAGMTITHVTSAVTYAGMPVGNIDQDLGSNPIVIGGHSTANSAPIDITMNLEPAAVALLLRSNAVSAGLNVQPLDALLTMGGFDIQGQEQISPSSSIFNGFNIVNFVTQALANLHVDLQLLSTIVIGQYTDDLAFVQSNVACTTDSSISKLIPIVGQPLVQSIIDASQLSFDSVVLSSPTDSNFQVQMNGKITGTGPFSATISFPTPLSVAWEGRTLGTVSMANIVTQPDVGATFSVSGTFTITDQTAMGDFSGYMLNNNNFGWAITGSGVSVTALGYTFTGLTMSKTVELSGMQGLKNDITIQSFNLPANSPNGGIELDVVTNIKNPSNVGVDLSGVGFESYYQSVDLGPLASVGGANFPPQGQSAVSMSGRLVPQSSSDGLNAIQTIFTNYLSGKDTPLTVKGSSASGPSGQVGWLTSAFKTLTIDNVLLPGAKGNITLIPSITLKQLSLDFTKGAYDPVSSSNDIEATLQSPFGFPLDVTSLSQTLSLKAGGVVLANLNIPSSPATTTGNIVKTGYTNVPFQVPSDSHEAFNQFVKALTLTGENTFELTGTAQAKTGTAVGSIDLGDIAFDVQTSMMGFNNFGGVVTTNSISIVGATASYVDTKLSVTLNNPSPISITVGDVTLRVMYQGYDIGPAIITNLIAVPGANTYDADFQLTPTADSAQQIVIASVLSGYLMQQSFDFQVVGNTASTSVESLQEGFAGLNLKTTLTGIPATLVTSSALANFGLATGCDSLLCASANFVIQNSIDTGFSLISVNADVYYQPQDTTLSPVPVLIGTVTATLSPPLFIGAHQSATSPYLLMAVNVDGATLVVTELFSIYESDYKFIKVNVQQNATITVGDDGAFHGVLAYAQDNVLVDISNMFNPVSTNAIMASLSASANASSSIPLSTALPGSSSTPSASIVPSAPVTSTVTSTLSSDTTTTTTDPATTTETPSATTTTDASINTIGSSGSNDANSSSA